MLTLNKFKAGDRVVCVDNSGRQHLVNKGDVYTVKNSSETLIGLKEFSGLLWKPQRFKLYEPRIKRNLPSWF